MVHLRDRGEPANAAPPKAGFVTRIKASVTPPVTWRKPRETEAVALVVPLRKGDEGLTIGAAMTAQSSRIMDAREAAEPQAKSSHWNAILASHKESRRSDSTPRHTLCAARTEGRGRQAHP